MELQPVSSWLPEMLAIRKVFQPDAEEPVILMREMQLTSFCGATEAYVCVCTCDATFTTRLPDQQLCTPSPCRVSTVLFKPTDGGERRFTALGDEWVNDYPMLGGMLQQTVSARSGFKRGWVAYAADSHTQLDNLVGPVDWGDEPSGRPCPRVHVHVSQVVLCVLYRSKFRSIAECLCNPDAVVRTALLRQEAGDMSMCKQLVLAAASIYSHARGETCRNPFVLKWLRLALKVAQDIALVAKFCQNAGIDLVHPQAVVPMLNACSANSVEDVVQAILPVPPAWAFDESCPPSRNLVVSVQFLVEVALCCSGSKPDVEVGTEVCTKFLAMVAKHLLHEDSGEDWATVHVSVPREDLVMLAGQLQNMEAPSIGSLWVILNGACERMFGPLKLFSQAGRAGGRNTAAAVTNTIVVSLTNWLHYVRDATGIVEMILGGAFCLLANRSHA